MLCLINEYDRVHVLCIDAFCYCNQFKGHAIVHFHYSCTRELFLLRNLEVDDQV